MSHDIDPVPIPVVQQYHQNKGHVSSLWVIIVLPYGEKSIFNILLFHPPHPGLYYNYLQDHDVSM